MHRQGPWWRFAAGVSGAAAAIVAGCGDSDGTSPRAPTPAHNASASTSTTTVPEDVRTPAAQSDAAGLETARSRATRRRARQLLAFAGDRHVGVVDGDRVRVLARAAAGRRVFGLQWSADGRQLGWLRGNSAHVCRSGPCPEFVLTVVDVASGRQHRHILGRGTARSTAERLAESPYYILAPGLRGVTLGDHRLGFTEFFADGRSTRYVVPVPFNAGVRIESTDILPVPFASRISGAWLVATVDPTLTGPLRLYRYSPPRRTITALDRLHTLVADPTAFAGPAFAADGGAVVWTGAYPPTDEPGGLGCDDPSHRLQTPTGRLPAFPRSPGWYWRAHEVTLGPHGTDAIAGRTRNPTNLETPHPCDRPRDAFEHLSLRAGRWSVTARGVLSISFATDGRLAQATGNIAVRRRRYGFGEFVEGRSATLTRPGARAIDLPRGTLRVLFSPSAPITR